MKIVFITLFPDMLEGYFATSMMRKATELGAAEFHFLNLRDYGTGPRQQVDDMPFGGGDGMVLKVGPIESAVNAAKDLCSDDAKVVLATPRGDDFAQADASRLASDSHDLIFICGRYEGYDERIVRFVDYQFRVGRAVLTGGELPSAMIADSVVRLLPDVLGGTESALKESFTTAADDVEHAQYTRPADYNGDIVPDVLISGDHAAIDKWRQDNSSKTDQ